MRTRHCLWLAILIVVALANNAFAAKAEQSNYERATRPVISYPVAGGAQDDVYEVAKAPTQSTGTGSRGPEDRFIGYKVGSTWYDYQHNGTMGRQIAQGADGRIHFVWTHKPDGTLGNDNRSIYYNSAIYTGGAWVFSHDTSGVEISNLHGGYSNVGVWGSRAVAAWHECISPICYSTYSAIDFVSGGASFTASAAPVDYTCSGTETNDDDEPFNYLWPIIDVDETGSGSDPIVMAVTVESIGNTSDDRSMVYFRGTANPTNYGSCGEFIDSVTSISPLVRQDPNSDEVAMAWLRPRGVEAEYNQFNNDIMVMYSSDNGASWGPPTNITDYPIEAQNRPYADLTGMYTSDGCFHLVWSSLPYNEAAATYSQLGNLEHWDDCNDCFSTLIATDNYDPDCGGPGRWNTNAAKPNLAECGGKLYCTYTYFKDDESLPDCSAGGWANGELYLQVSTTGGVTWGPPTNLSNTPDNGCLAGDCESEHWASTVMYGDSLYIFYVGDTDAGGWAAGSSGFEGTGQEDPMMFYVHPCIEMDAYVDLKATPNSIGYPFRTAVSTQTDTTVQLLNVGNTGASFTTSISYISGSGWLDVAPSSGVVPAGCWNTEDLTLTATGPAPEGLYEATVTVNYPSGSLDIDVDFYSFDDFCLPTHVRLRTPYCLLSVAQESRTANQVDDAGFAWFADTTNYLFDGGLVLSNPNTGSWDFNVFHSLAQQPTPDNPWRPLYTTDCVPDIDTTCGLPTYRTVSGSGVNSDSTMQFDVTWYASCHPDSANFFIGHFEFGPGPNYQSPLNNVTIAYACDWDIPSDTLSDNRGYADESEQTVYQQGLYAGSPHSNELRYAGLAYRGHTTANEFAAGGEVWDNPRYVYPDNGYHVDSLSARLPGMSGWSVNVPDSSTDGEDLSAVLVIDNNATITSNKETNPDFNLVFWGSNPNQSYANQNYTEILDKAEAFICEYISPDAPFCEQEPCNCGDANNDGLITVSDAVFLVQYLYGGGPAPDPLCLGEANGCGTVDIADAITIIQWIFNSGPAPQCSDGEPCPSSSGGTIELDCPQVAEPTGNPVGVPVYMSNLASVYGMSFGFQHNSADIEMSSFSLTGGVLEADSFYTGTYFYPAENRMVFYWAGYSTVVAPQSDALIGTLWFDVPAGTANQTIDIDTSTVIAGGNLVLIESSEIHSYPAFDDCGTSDLIIVSDTCTYQYPGDVDANGFIETPDLTYLVQFLYGSGPAPDPLANGDLTGDCCIDSADVVYLTEYLFQGGPDPVECTCVHPGVLCHDVCGNSFTDPVFIVCPGGDAVFEVHLRDECNDPVPWVNSVWIELYACDGMDFCPDQSPLDSIPPLGPSDAAGVMRFVYAGGGYDGDCYAVVKIPDGRCDIATVPVLSYDTNGDLGVGDPDFIHDSEACDYNGNGRDDDQDYEFFLEHLGHYCGLTECERFGSQFNLDPATDHFPGRPIDLDLILTNNNFDSCFVGLVEFFYSPTGSGQNLVWFHSEMYDHAMAPGEEDTISVEYTVPTGGAGCLYVEFETDCCSTTVIKESCLESNLHCTADSTYEYNFYIFLSGTPVVDSVIVDTSYLLPEWPPLQIPHWPPGFPLTNPDFIQYVISTSPNAQISDVSKLFTKVYSGGSSTPEYYRHAVVITNQTGDCDGDCIINISDVVAIIRYIFAGGDPCNPQRAGDANCDGLVNITDAVYLINYIFSGGAPPCVINPYFD